VKANGISRVVSLDAGYDHTCALTASATILCWGENASGQLGDGTGVGSLTPVAVKGGLRFP
jgi:alpha-tubulin suppressor-like RCC1 family protein